MKKFAGLLLSFGLVLGVASSAMAGPLYEDGSGDAWENGTTGPYATAFDIKSARFTEAKKKFFFNVSLYEVPGTESFCTIDSCGEFSDIGYVDVDFYTLDKNEEHKNYYFAQIRLTDDGLKAFLVDYINHEDVATLSVLETEDGYRVPVKRSLLKGMKKGASLRWYAQTVYWADTEAEGDSCKFGQGSNANACIDYVPDTEDAIEKLKK